MKMNLDLSLLILLFVINGNQINKQIAIAFACDLHMISFKNKDLQKYYLMLKFRYLCERSFGKKLIENES